MKKLGIGLVTLLCWVLLCGAVVHAREEFQLSVENIEDEKLQVIAVYQTNDLEEVRTLPNMLEWNGIRYSRASDTHSLVVDQTPSDDQGSDSSVIHTIQMQAEYEQGSNAKYILKVVRIVFFLTLMYFVVFRALLKFIFD